jgi:hypothetical protein
MLLWPSAIAGALEEHEHRAKPKAAGFEAIAIENRGRELCLQA